MDSQFSDIFKEEAYEILEELQGSLLELEKNKDDKELVSKVFRQLHTIKGSGAMFGFDQIADFTHQVENMFDLVRNDELELNSDIIDVSLKAADYIKMLLDSTLSEQEAESEGTVLADMICKISGEQDNSASTEEHGEAEVSEESELKTFRIRFIPEKSILRDGIEIEGLFHELKKLGETAVVGHISDKFNLRSFKYNDCFLFWDILVTCKKELNDIKDIFIFFEGRAEIRIDMIDSEEFGDEEEEYKKLGNILVEKGDLSETDMESILEKKKKFGEILIEEGVAGKAEILSALTEQSFVRKIREERKKRETVSSIRVSSEKTDKLVDLVGELVTAQAHLTQMAVDERNSELQSLAEQFERLIWELSDNTMSIRMLPVGSLFNRFKRQVRDLSSDLGKNITLYTEGEETEIDKAVIDKLNDPLVHLIRNAVDHGIGTDEERLACGKKSGGSIYLSADYSGANVIISVRDDGKGIDPEKLKAKAEERGINISRFMETDSNPLNLIFEPGLSTSEKISDVSGRGVGMDVVRTNIEELGGLIDVESTPGKGTQITLKLPLTLAIIDGLLVKLGDELFVMPLSIIEECIELTEADRNANRGNYINVRGEVVSYIDLRKEFDTAQPPPAIQQVVIASLEAKRVGFVIDEVVGEHQTVIKSLGTVYRKIEGFSGATILGDGKIALILDLFKITKNSEDNCTESEIKNYGGFND